MPTQVNPHPPKKRRFMPFLLSGCAVAFGSALVAGGTLIWQLSQGPINANLIIPAIERSLEGGSNLHFNIGNVTLNWKSGNNPLSLDINDITVSGEMGTFLSLNKLDLTLAPLPLLWGKIEIANAALQGIRLRITRQEDGKITLTGSDTQSHTSTTTALNLEELTTRLPAIEHLVLLNSSLIFEDKKDAIIRSFNKVDLAMAQQGSGKTRSITGYITAPLSDEDHSGTIALDFAYNAPEKKLNTAATLHGADIRTLFGRTLWRAGLPVVDMKMDGRANITFNNDFMLDDISLRLSGGEGTLRWPRHFGPDLPIQHLTRFELDLGYNPNTTSLELNTAEITSKGLTISASGKLRADEKWHNLEGNLAFHIPVLAVDLLPEIWPQKWAPDIREWLVDKMDSGRFADINLNIPLNAHLTDIDHDDSLEWDITTGNITADFDFTGINVNYNPPMLPANNTTGTGTFEGTALTLNIKRAQAGNLHITSGRLFFNDLVNSGTGTAHLEFDIDATAPAIFEYITPPPISYRDKIDLDLAQTKGEGKLKVDVKFPTTAELDIDDVHVDVRATLNNFETPPVLKGLSLSGDNFELSASQHHFTLKGEGKLGDSPAKISWHEVFEPKTKNDFSSKIDLEIQTDKILRQKFIGAIEDRITGLIPAKLSLQTLKGGETKLTGALTLTPARLDLINPLNIVKQRGINSTLDFTATLKDDTLQSIDTITARGPSLSIESGQIILGTQNTATLHNLKAGNTNANITAIWTDDNFINANISGTSFDARYVLGHSEYDNAAGTDYAYDLNLELSTLYITDRPLTDITAHFIGETAGTYKLANMNANIGDGHITLRYAATGQDSDRLFLEMTDAGAGLRALGINERVRGGYLRAEGLPYAGGNAGDMQGTLRLEDFSIRRAPALAKLVNMLSLPGVLNLLSQDTGLKFKRAEANVTMLNRDGGATFLIRDGRTSGASLGLTFEGEVNQADHTLALQGTVVPMSEINTALAGIPIIGNILTGGKLGSGIFSATYNIKGPSADPDINVNPLSVLTPGILRRILFEGTLANTPTTP